jgi:mRNA-degrading endonuclease RelE of RelBE toxin-antitoxin system
LNEHESPFSVIIEKTVQKQLQSIPRSDAIKVLVKIDILRGDPLPKGCKKLSVPMSSFRFRFRIQDVGHRKNVYARL